MDVYRLSWEGIGNAAGQYCQLIQMDVHADEPLQINGALLANSVFFNVGLVFSSSTNIGSSNFFDCTVMNASYGLYLSGVDDLFGDRLPITNCTFTDCGVGVYANNSRLLLDNCTITGSNAATTAGAGVYLSNCGLGKVIIDGCTINENGTGSTISSSGIYLSSSSPEIIWTEVKDNSGGGIYCSGSTPDLDTYDYLLLNDQPNSIESNGGLVQTGSDGAEIYFASSSYPAIKYNNITDGSPPVGYLIYKDQTSNMYGVTATNNYWGGTPSDSWFYWGTGLAIDYSNSSTTRLSSAEEFEYAMSLWNEGDFTGAAEAFAECIADTGDIGIKAVHYLSGCTGQMERRDYDGLREFLLDAADGHADARVGKVAARFATDCLTQQGLFDEAMEEFDAARANAECLEDSVLAVVDWLAVYELANGGDLDAAERDIAGRTSGLLGLLSGGRNGASAVLPEEVILASCYPNPFNATTTLTFSLPEASDVRLSVFDLSGREVASLENGKLEAGNHSATWNAEGFTSGIYFVKIETPAFSATKKVTLVR